MTLQEILEAMANQDENPESFSKDDMKLIAEKLGDKIDGYKKILDTLESDAKRLAKEIKSFQKAKKTVENNHKRISEHLLYMMKSRAALEPDCGGKYKLRGDKYIAHLRSRTTQSTNRPPEEADFIGFDNLVKIAFAWDTDAVKEAAKTDADAAALLSEKKSEYVEFTVRKEI